ncbi:MAG: 16S rRNA (guanine(527)-N(7))-methyltransferase RsmG [Alloprevotella sp.]|nr:16S rRNA (guanine(527)-N(7))-methyltransferase RsmG [Alloprevotella sp.]
MDNISVIQKYFKELSEKQTEQLIQLGPLYAEWNEKINVISRKDIDNLYLHHILHSLGITKVIRFRPQTKVLDLGTGGGFPGIPLAILFPEVKFTLIDSIGKKTLVAKTVAEAIGLQNVEILHRNIVEERRKYDFVVSRAVAQLGEIINLTKKNLSNEQHNALPNGILCLKGGDLSEELKRYKKSSETWTLSDFFNEDFFETKHVVYVHA